MDENLKSGLLGHLDRGKPVRVLGRDGDTESMTFAREIHAFLQASGYSMATPIAFEHQFFGVKPLDVTINLHAQNGEEVWLVVGAAK
jgi:hypothetical protein